MLHFLLKHSTSQHRKRDRRKNEAYIEGECHSAQKKLKSDGTEAVFFFSSHVEVLVSDSLDSSTIKTTHFKDSEDESGDLRELKDRTGDAGPFSFFFPPPP